ncbi:hypothetical protein AeRB84_016490 [Aphanomyces euteiches]|nr:hypothetical protein AeRB84_016490 [Aphanomyces euteiches]
MLDCVHVDEKWFYVTQVKEKVYVYDDEVLAARSTKSKSFITKVLFLAAVARPRYNNKKEPTFDEKIDIWPFLETTHAQSNSKNRPKGSLVLTRLRQGFHLEINLMECLFSRTMQVLINVSLLMH